MVSRYDGVSAWKPVPRLVGFFWCVRRLKKEVSVAPSLNRHLAATKIQIQVLEKFFFLRPQHSLFWIFKALHDEKHGEG